MSKKKPGVNLRIHTGRGFRTLRSVWEGAGASIRLYKDVEVH